MVSERSEPAADIPGASASKAALESLSREFDEAWGGFGPAPKFPSPANLYLLLSEASRGNEEARRMLESTLHKMGEGALYDHLGGGFHRYATDREWRIPHFEKMLYDNAALSEILVDTARLTSDPELERLARGTLDFVLEGLTDDDGGFLSAIDAQTDGREGAYYVWTREELERVLSPEELDLLAPIFGLDGAPNFEENHFTLYLTSSLAGHAERLDTSREGLLARISPALEKLRRARHLRPFPLVDDKVLTDWNGMMVAAMAKAGSTFGEPRYRRAAERAASFLLEELRSEDGTLQHLWRGGNARVDAFLDDYAFLTRGLLVLHRESGEVLWLEEAERLVDQMESRLRDPRGGYYQTVEKPYLLFQAKGANDGAIVSANGVAASVLLELHELTGKAVYRSRAEDAMRAFASDLERYPEAAMTLALAVERYHSDGPVEAWARTSSGAEASWIGVRVSLRIEEGWHINANPASSPYLIPTEIRGEVRNVVYPRGKSMSFGFSKEPLSVYDGELAL
ncbi:MAG: thioredoxin domain-containing protein, partial [Vicinamibacteria bacterium]